MALIYKYLTHSLRAKKCVCVIATLLMTPAAVALADSIPPPEAFGALPSQTYMESSPDGHWMAWLDNTHAEPRVIIFDLEAHKPQRILAIPEGVKTRHLWWNDNETLLIQLSETDESKYSKWASLEYYRVIAHDVHGGDGRMLPMDSGGAKVTPLSPPLIRLVRIRTSKPHTIYASKNGLCRATIANCLLEIDTVTGRSTVVKVGNGYTTSWVVDADGHPVAREDWDWHQSAYRVFALEDGDRIREIIRTDDSQHPKLQGMMPDNSGLVLLANNGRPHQAAWVLPLDGTPIRLLFEDPDADVESTVKDPNTNAVVGVFVGGEHERYKWIDPQALRRAETIDKTFKDKTPELINWSADGTKVLALVQTPSIPPVYYWINFTSHRADIAGEEYPALTDTSLGRVEKTSYKARDGMTIPALLTRPAGVSGTPLPLVVLPHGGPTQHDYFRFNWLTQFFATRGYAVLQPQFRGSSGYGQAFQEAGYKQWGGVMQDDITDGVKAMIDRGVADANRVCIVGDTAYGGYAALAGASFTPKLYRCAVSINGISDLPALVRNEVPLESIASTTGAYWKARIGTPNDPHLGAVSPINSVKNIEIPVSIIYGTGDNMIPIDQSLRMIAAMRSAGKKVEVDTLDGEDHWLSQAATRIQVLRTLDTFLKAHL